MLTAGIICEYNPFHNGHLSLIRRLREKGATHIAAVMSGDFVQRGDAALLSKWARTRQALSCGVDLVVELPLPWSLAGAERFALGGTALLDFLGADVIGFGSECGDLGALQSAAGALGSDRLRGAMRQKLNSGATFAAARQSAVESLFGPETASLLREPNNILGIEYLRAIERLSSRLTPWTFPREGPAHDSPLPNGNFATASKIRSAIRKGENVSAWMPRPAWEVLQAELSAGRAPANLKSAERAVLAKLRSMTKDEFRALPDLSEGLENRVFTAARKARSLEELYFLIKTKRYPLARIRRIVLAAFLGVRKEDAAGLPPYVRILGIGRGGTEILRKAGGNSSVPILARFSDFLPLTGKAKRLAELGDHAADLFSLCTPNVLPCGVDRTTGIITVRPSG